MFTLFLGLLTLGATALFYIFNRIIIGAATCVLWILLGAQVYGLRAASLDIYHLTGIFLIMVGTMFSIEVFTDLRTERKAEREEELIDNLEELEEELEDARDQEDWPLVRKLEGKIVALREHDQKFSTTVTQEPRTLRKRIINGKRYRKYWNKFDNEGTM